MRLFVGIPLAEPVIEELAAVAVRLQSRADDLRWPGPETWHITLQFLGNTAEYECIVGRLRDVRALPVPVALEGFGMFERAGIFYVGVHLTPELRELQESVVAATGRCGFVPETRPYHPHITLARSKGRNVRALRGLKAGIKEKPNLSSFVAQAFVLYESQTRAGGSQYQIRERFPLVSL
jgi:RNA 2',3'-cyclic 3'-phosphodiesterase